MSKDELPLSFDGNKKKVHIDLRVKRGNDRSYINLTRRNFALSVPFFLTGATTALPQELSVRLPDGDVILRIDGDISVRNDERQLSLDQTMLDELPQAEFATSTIWTEGIDVFSGPTLKVLVDFAGGGSGDVIASALNDYKMTIPRSFIEDVAPIVATRINGRTFSVREKGPLWIIFPYDKSEQYRSELTYALSVWQLGRLTVDRT